MSSIKIDYDIFDTTISCYDENIKKLTENRNAIITIFNNLETYWKGNSKEKFFANIYTNVTKSMQSDINHLVFLKNQLINTKKEFENLERSYKNKLKINR